MIGDATVERLEGDVIKVTLPEQLTIGTSASLYEALCRVVESTDVVVLNASEVEKADTAGLQLLAAFARERRDQSLITEFRHRSDKVNSALSMLGLTGAFS